VKRDKPLFRDCLSRRLSPARGAKSLRRQTRNTKGQGARRRRVKEKVKTVAAPQCRNAKPEKTA